MEDLFPRERPAGSLDITRQLFNAVATNYSLLVPSPTAGFTLFATSDAGYAKSQQGAPLPSSQAQAATSAVVHHTLCAAGTQAHMHPD